MEQRLLDSLRRRLEADPLVKRRLVRGIGDDAAILRPLAGNAVVTTDLLSDGVDFLAAETEPEKIGRKALGVNLSDLAAMGARPHSAFVSLLLPKSADGFLGKTPTGKKTGKTRREAEADSSEIERFVERLYDGMIPLAREFGIVIAGGDINSGDGPFAVSITAIGAVAPGKAFLRTGARAGDRILTTGRFGGSIFGRQFTFVPRIREAIYLARHSEIHAAMDVSDGLLLDLTRLASESGCGFLLHDALVPIHPDVLRNRKKKRFDGSPQKSPLDSALTDGEDFELILAVPPEAARKLLSKQPFRGDGDNPALLTDLGEFLPRKNGFARLSEEGELRPVDETGGWTHFF